MDFSELLGGGNDVVLDSEDDELLEPGTTLVGFPSVPPSAFSHSECFASRDILAIRIYLSA